MTFLFFIWEKWAGLAGRCLASPFFLKSQKLGTFNIFIANKKHFFLQIKNKKSQNNFFYCLADVGKYHPNQKRIFCTHFDNFGPLCSVMLAAKLVNHGRSLPQITQLSKFQGNFSFLSDGWKNFRGPKDCFFFELKNLLVHPQLPQTLMHYYLDTLVQLGSIKSADEQLEKYFNFFDIFSMLCGWLR